MNALGSSECGSGCESGWTLYLEQSFLSPSAAHGRRGRNTRQEKHIKQEFYVEEDDDDVDDDDLSMVSDASSGPPHFNEEESYLNYDNGCFYTPTATTLINNGGEKRQKEGTKRAKEHQELPNSSFLDDTASSPAFNLSKDSFVLAKNNHSSMDSMLDYSQGFSATHFQGRSSYQDHFGYVHPSLPGNQFQNNQWF